MFRFRRPYKQSCLYIWGWPTCISHIYANGCYHGRWYGPAIGYGLATIIAKNKFDKSEREAGKAAFVLGLCFITEGSIPFAAKDPARVIPCNMIGGAVTGALSMLFGAQLMAPHGGLFVLLIPNAVTPVFLYLVAIAAGTAVTGISYAF